MARKILPRRVPRDRFIQRGGSSGGSLFGGSSIPGTHTHVEAEITDLGPYLLLTGGTLTGDLLTTGDIEIQSAQMLRIQNSDNTEWAELRHTTALTFTINLVNSAWVAFENMTSGLRINVRDNAPSQILIGESSTLRGNSQNSLLRLYGEDAAADISNATFNYLGPHLLLTTDASPVGEFRSSLGFVAETGSAIVVKDATNADNATWSHDGTDFNLVLTGTADYNIAGFTGMVRVNLEANTNSILTVGESTTLRGDEQRGRLHLASEIGGAFTSAQFANIGNSLLILHSTGSVRFESNVQIRGGKNLTIQDAGDTDWGTWSHDGTDFNLDFTNTADYNITGLTDALKLSSDSAIGVDVASEGEVSAGGTAMFRGSRAGNGSAGVDFLKVRILGDTNNPSLIISGRETENQIIINATGSAGTRTLLFAIDSNQKFFLDANGLRCINGLGIHGAASSTTQPTVTGSRASNAALASLLTALATYGLIVDSTS